MWVNRGRRWVSHQTGGPTASQQRSGWRWRAMHVLVTLLLTLAIVGVYGLNTAPTHADSGPLQVVNLPPSLLSIQELTQTNGLFYANFTQLTALSDLEQQAVANTLADHNLPAADENAVLSWGRDDAEAELWNLLRQAATAQNPTADQKAATAWLASVAYREGVQSANDAGLEYTKWAGLDVNTYNSLVSKFDSDISAGNDTTTDKTNLENFLKQQPVAFNSTNVSTATGGYCAYVPPAPYQSDYTDNIQNNSPTCEQIATLTCEAGCIPATPDISLFEKWGATDANNTITSNPSFTQTAQNIALGLGLGGVAASVAAGVGISLTMAGVMAGTAFESAVFPFASIPWFAAGTGGAYILPEFGAVAASGVGAIVGAVLLFIVGTTIQAINLANYLDAPGKVAGYVEGAASNSYSPASMLNSQNSAGELYSLFVDATLPPPPPAADTGVAPFPETDCAGSYADSYNYIHTCLDPPAPPAYSPQTDPAFIVSENSGTGTLQKTITWYDKATKLANTAYLHGTWFVDTVTTSDGTVLQAKDDDDVTRTLLQYLRIHYTDWAGNEQAAYLVNIPGTGYEFVSINQQSSTTPLNPSTCVTDKTCTISTNLEYVDSSGNKYSAKAIPPPLPTISQTLVINPIEGSPATLQATASSPINTTLSYQWQIEDKPLSTSITTCLNSQFQIVPCPPPTVTVTGNPAQYTFPTSGNFAVTLTVTNTTGQYAKSSFTVFVRDIAPTLSINPSCDGTANPCNTLAAPLGTATTIGGAVVHVGAEDVETLDVNWGDGTTDSSVTNTACYLGGCALPGIFPAQFNISGITTVSGQIYLPFTATHTYANPGVYIVTVKTTDQSGATTTKTLTETVLIPTTTSLSSNVNPSVWGQPVTLTATISSAIAGSPTGTVTFKDNGSVISGCGAQQVDTITETATCVTSALSVTYGVLPNGDILFPTPHSITAEYSGDSVYAKSASPIVSQSVGQASTTTTLSSSVNPSVWGQPVTFTAKVAAVAPGAGTPTGTVTFYDGTTALGTGSLSTSGGVTTATFTTSSLAVGARSITASYAGSLDFTGSASSALTQTVNKANTSVVVTSANNPVTHGQSVTFTARVTAVAPGAGTPTGTVTFFDGTTTLGTGSLSTSGGVTTATFTTSSLTVGARNITASYAGDGHFLGSASSALTQYINTDLSSYPTLPNGAYNLANANLSGGYFVDLSLKYAVMSGSNLTNAVFLRAKLTGADMSNSNFMSNANFTDAIMLGVNLSNSDLKGANFTGVNLTGVNFTNSNLKGANLTNSNLTGATGMSTANLSGVTWSNTTCPDGTNSSADGGTCAGHF